MTKRAKVATLPRVGSLWQRKDQSAPELIMVMSSFDTGAIGFSPVSPNGPPQFQSLLALNLFLDRFEPLRRATDGKEREKAMRRTVPNA